MTRFSFELDLGERVRIVYGYDYVLGYFVRIRKGYPGKEIASYDNQTEGYDGLRGLLRTLVSAGVFTATEVADAVNLVFQTSDVDKLDSEDVGRAAIMVMHLTGKKD